jgi:hypothetical protein
MIRAMGKNNINKGIIVAGEVEEVRKKLEIIKAKEKFEKNNNNSTDFVPFSNRIFPLIEMLKKASESNEFILWEKF